MHITILLLFEYGTLNGGEWSLLSMLEVLGQDSLAFIAAAPAEGRLVTQLERLGIETLPLDLRDGGGQKKSPDQVNAHLQELISKVAPDLVHANSLSMGRMLGRIAATLPMPCTTHLRDIIKLNRAAIDDLNKLDGLIAVSRATRQFHVGQGMDADKVQVIYNGVDTERFKPQARTLALRQSLGLSDSDLMIVNIGQICLRKGQTLLAQAAVALAKTFPLAHYVFVGERYSQKQESVDYENRLVQIFQDAGIEDRLHKIGFRSDIPQILSEADLLVHTAHQEPLGRVLLEAAACAKPIIATDVGGTAEILSHEQSALLIPSDDLEALCAALRQALSEKSFRQSMGETARRTTLERFSLPNAVENIRVFWNSCL